MEYDFDFMQKDLDELYPAHKMTFFFDDDDDMQMYVSFDLRWYWRPSGQTWLPLQLKQNLSHRPRTADFNSMMHSTLEIIMRPTPAEIRDRLLEFAIVLAGAYALATGITCLVYGMALAGGAA